MCGISNNLDGTYRRQACQMHQLRTFLKNFRISLQLVILTTKEEEEEEEEDFEEDPFEEDPFAEFDLGGAFEL